MNPAYVEAYRVARNHCPTDRRFYLRCLFRAHEDMELLIKRRSDLEADRTILDLRLRVLRNTIARANQDEKET